MKEVTQTISQGETENTFGKMVHFTRDSLKTVFEMEKVSGNLVLSLLKEPTLTIRRVAKEFTTGVMGKLTTKEDFMKT